ncbi:MAG: cyclic-di-AMP receptor [Armatimonadetes bacterium]|nr:cyclic-di-AMP receptor [Armatimonadota bacterium]
MKLVISIVQERDKHKVSDALVQAGHQFTTIATTGGFMRDGNSTILIGAPEEEVEDVIATIRSCCSSREEYVNQPPPDALGAGAVVMNPIKVCVGGAIIFVVDVEKFERV